MNARHAARIVVVNEAGHVLLFRCVDPKDEARGPFWITPGGGIEADESPLDAAVRELFEETGQVVAATDLVGPIARSEGPVVFRGEPGYTVETFYAWRTTTFDPHETNVDEIELEIMGKHEWMHPDAIDSHHEVIYPVALAPLVRDLYAGTAFEEPRTLAWRPDPTR